MGDIRDNGENPSSTGGAVAKQMMPRLRPTFVEKPPTPDYYKILNVKLGSKTSWIHQTFKEQSLVAGIDPEKLRLLKEAHAVLTNHDLRPQYNKNYPELLRAWTRYNESLGGRQNQDIYPYPRTESHQTAFIRTKPVLDDLTDPPNPPPRESVAEETQKEEQRIAAGRARDAEHDREKYEEMDLENTLQLRFVKMYNEMEKVKKDLAKWKDLRSCRYQRVGKVVEKHSFDRVEMQMRYPALERLKQVEEEERMREEEFARAVALRKGKQARKGSACD